MALPVVGCSGSQVFGCSGVRVFRAGRGMASGPEYLKTEYLNTRHPALFGGRPYRGHGQRGVVEGLRGYRGDLVVSDRLVFAQDLGDRDDAAVCQQRVAVAVHAGVHILQAQDERAPDLRLRLRQLVLGEPLGAHFGELLTRQVQDLLVGVRAGASVDAEVAAVLIGAAVGADRVGETALLPDLLEQPRAHVAAQHVIEDGEGEPLRVVLAVTGVPKAEVRLLDVAALLAGALAGRLRPPQLARRGAPGQAAERPIRQLHQLGVIEVSRPG